MLHVEELTFGNLSGGLFDGYCAIHLLLGVTSASQPHEASQLSASILKFGRTRLFHFSGDYKRTSQEELKLLLSTLRENGYTILCRVNGTERYEWFSEVGYRIVMVTEGPWLTYAAHEIHFCPILKQDIQPPILTDIHKASVLYLDADRDIAADEVFSFLERNPLWRISNSPRRVYRMPIEVGS